MKIIVLIKIWGKNGLSVIRSEVSDYNFLLQNKILSKHFEESVHIATMSVCMSVNKRVLNGVVCYRYIRARLFKTNDVVS